MGREVGLCTGVLVDDETLRVIRCGVRRGGRAVLVIKAFEPVACPAGEGRIGPPVSGQRFGYKHGQVDDPRSAGDGADVGVHGTDDRRLARRFWRIGLRSTSHQDRDEQAGKCGSRRLRSRFEGVVPLRDLSNGLAAPVGDRCHSGSNTARRIRPRPRGGSGTVAIREESAISGVALSGACFFRRLMGIDGPP